MVQLAYHASHEQFAPSHLLKLATLAEAAGFDAIHSSDHFNPWSKRQGHSGYSFGWVATVLQATTLPVGMICTPGQRYHPAIVAQAIATLAEMFPNRLTVEMATGEALNEMITGDPWPSKRNRNERLAESVKVIRELLKGETVTIDSHIKLKDARIWSLPAVAPPLFCAAISAETSGWCGNWSDGLITISGTADDIREKINAFYKNGGEGKPVHVQYSFSYASSKKEALDAAHDQWRSNLVDRDELADLRTTSDFDRTTESITKDEVREKIPLITSIQELLNEIRKISIDGVKLVSLHNVNRNHEFFIQQFQEYKTRQ